MARGRISRGRAPGRARRRIAWLALLALALNATLPHLALASLPRSADLFASAICHLGSLGTPQGQDQPAEPATGKTVCPLCLLLSLPLPGLPAGAWAAVPPPLVAQRFLLPPAQAPPPAGQASRPQSARGPPRLS